MLKSEKLKIKRQNGKKNKQNEFTEKAEKWMQAYGRKAFTIDKIIKDTYICSLHFVDGNGPTEEDPDPINTSLLQCELLRKKDEKKEETLTKRPLVSQEEEVRAKRTNKHGESEISPLNSVVQNDETDFDEPLVGDVSTLSTLPPHDEQESISFNISYDDVLLQSNEPEVNEVNETSLVKTDKSTQTKYDKYTLCAKIENIILKHEIKPLKSSQKQRH